ncbi:MAG TPA: response regulator [Candidatus Marinimicrobia bacterium]|nr:response regulator [Candidatus Neomarinimicrobiota bacterium]
MALNVLIVDDSETVRSVIIKTLGIAQIPVNTIYQAANGKEALSVLEEQWIDIVFADINMPVMGGIEMVEKMSEDGLLKSVPVVIVSIEGSSTRIEQLKKKGISAYIRKPFTPETIRKVVDDIFGV